MNKEERFLFYKSHKWVRIFVKVIVVLVILFLFVEIFTHLYPEFGGRVTHKDREDYQKRADVSYYDGKKFFYPEGWKLSGLSENREISKKGTSPKDSLPVMEPDYEKVETVNEIGVTWFGHSSMLIQMHGKKS